MRRNQTEVYVVVFCSFHGRKLANYEIRIRFYQCSDANFHVVLRYLIFAGILDYENLVILPSFTL